MRAQGDLCRDSAQPPTSHLYNKQRKNSKHLTFLLTIIKTLLEKEDRTARKTKMLCHKISKMAFSS